MNAIELPNVGRVKSKRGPSQRKNDSMSIPHAGSALNGPIGIGNMAPAPF